MRDRLTPDQFNKWLAFRQICPDKMERLIEVCKRGLTLIANSWGAKASPDDLDPQKQERPEQEVTPEQAAMIARSTMGPTQR